MRFLFTTIQGFETEFYGRVGDRLAARGHDVEHVTYSRRAARLLREGGFSARSLPDLRAEIDPVRDLDAEARRIEREYDLGTIRELYRTDPPAASLSERAAVRRAVEHVRALEHGFDALEPDVLVPEVGNELLRVAAHTIALAREIPTLFLFYTIFPRPLRLYVDTMHAPIVFPDELRQLTPDEEAELESFQREFMRRERPIRPHRERIVTRRHLERLRAYVGARLGEDRDNEYLRPGAWLIEHAAERIRRPAARPLYDRLDPYRRFVYFPLHVSDDYKIKRLIPHCADQGAIVDLLADALPPRHDLVLKEHPMSIGRNPLTYLRRLKRLPNVRLVEPQTSTHDLIRRAEAVAVISSTVGLEALLYEKPVLTLGRPFYAGYGITVDIDSFADLPAATLAVLAFRPDRERVRRFLHAAMRRCYPGAPVLVDDSDANAELLAASLDAALAEARPVAVAP
jgi:Capsule polysaccharide biosynthesis protein